jgi:hypothetical protein
MRSTGDNGWFPIPLDILLQSQTNADVVFRVVGHVQPHLALRLVRGSYTFLHSEPVVVKGNGMVA